MSVNSVAPACDAHGITLRTEIDPSINGLVSAGLDSVILNALWNAIDALNAHDGGTVTIQANASDTALSVSIIDDGPGIPDDLIDRVFEVGVSSHTRTGIGLSHAKSIIDSLKGTIKLANNTDSTGATFSIVLPIDALRASAKRSEKFGGASR